MVAVLAVLVKTLITTNTKTTKVTTISTTSTVTKQGHNAYGATQRNYMNFTLICLGLHNSPYCTKYKSYDLQSSVLLFSTIRLRISETGWTIRVTGFVSRQKKKVFLPNSFRILSGTEASNSTVTKEKSNARQSPANSAQVTNAWIYTSTPGCDFLAWNLIRGQYFLWIDWLAVQGKQPSSQYRCSMMGRRIGG